MVKNLLANADEIQSLGQEDLLEKEIAKKKKKKGNGNPLQSLEGYSPKGCKELNTTNLVTK